MNEVITVSAMITLLYALFAVFSAWGVLRLFDRLGRVNFRATIGRISHDQHAAAHYFGLRFIGVCLLIGLVVS